MKGALFMESVTFHFDPKTKISLMRVFSATSDVNVKLDIDLKNNAIVVHDLDEDQFELAQTFIQQFGKIKSITMDNVCTSPSGEEDNKDVGLVINLLNPETLLLQETINSLMRTIYWAVHNQNVPEKIIKRYVLSCNGTLNMAYGKNDLIPIERGSLVDVCMGQNIPGELNGGNVPCIVCWVQEENFAHVVPLVSKVPNSSNASYTLTAKPEEDLTYFAGNQDTAYTVLLDKGQLIHRARIQKIMGKISKDFVNKVFNGIITCTVEKLGKKIKTKSDIPASAPQKEVTASKAPTKPSTGSGTSNGNLDVKPSTPTSKITVCGRTSNKHEHMLTTALAAALNSVNKANPKKDEIARFMERINMPKEEYTLFFQAFIQTASVDKIVKADICERVSVVSSDTPDKDFVAQSLKKQFQQWLNKNHPAIAAECPKISFVDLLKLVKTKF